MLNVPRIKFSYTCAKYAVMIIDSRILYNRNLNTSIVRNNNLIVKNENQIVLKYFNFFFRNSYLLN